MLNRRSLLAAAGAALAVPAVAATPARAVIVSRIVVTAGRIWTPATIGGRGPFRFIFDTGAAVSAIATPLAKQLGLRRFSRAPLIGIGGIADVDLYEAKDVVFGDGIRQPSVAFAGLDLPLGGAGLLAAGLITTRDSDLDFVASEWRIYPGGRPDFAGLTRLDGMIERHRAGSDKLLVDADLDGKTYRLLVDTGSPDELMLFPALVRRSGLWDDGRPFAPTPLRGIGGTADRIGRTVRGGRLTLGGFVFDKPLVKLHDPKDYSAARYDGILGLAAIERLNWTTDVDRSRLWARANGRDKPPERYGFSGLWLDRRKDGSIVVTTVSPGSPASAAGLQPGHILADTDWAATLRALGGAPGTAVTLTVAGPAGNLPRTVTLRAYL